MYRDDQLRDISEVSEVGITVIQQFRHLGPFTHPLSSSPSVDHDRSMSEKFCLDHFSFLITEIMIDNDDQADRILDIVDWQCLV